MFQFSEETVRLIEALLPLAVLALGFIFKLAQAQREELAHALHSAFERLQTGEIGASYAKDIVLATGAVSEKQIDRVLKEFEIRRDGNAFEVYRDNVIPGVGVSIDTQGRVEINPSGLINKAGHKLGKFAKKKLGVKLF